MSYSICLLCPSFDIGGAETHVLTLAHELSRRGHRVTVVSAGGAYEKYAKAKEASFRHVRLPLDRKRAFFVCYFGLKKLFKKERFDVVHAHARFPALLCRLLLGNRFVSTAHWVFSVRFPFRFLSAWGGYALAVSEDIAAYLAREYRYPRERVLVTVNGIDTDVFSLPASRAARLRVCYCSRLDRDRSASAFLLIDCASELAARFDFDLVIVGGGEDLTRLQEKAEGINRAHGRELIRLTGACDQVQKHLREAHIFVGVSRAALEAMACGCAVILAGNEGYLSVFSPSRASKAEESNFCCRDTAALSKEALFHDLSRLLSLSPEALCAMGKENRAYVQASYSKERMATDALTVYQQLMRKKCLLCGYYGFSNVGDMLTHRALLARLKREGYGEIKTLSARFFSPSSLYALWQGYDFFLGGGNLLQNETSTRSLRFYGFLLRFAAWRGAKVRLLSSGFGGFRANGFALAKNYIRYADSVECRTRGDYSLAEKLDARALSLRHDAVLDLSLGTAVNKDRVFLALKAPRTPEEELLLLAFLFRLCKHYGKSRLLLYAMHPQDAAFIRKTARRHALNAAFGDADHFIEQIKQSAVVYTERLHAAVCALSLGIPVFLRDTAGKNRFFAEDTAKAAQELSLPSPVLLFSPQDNVFRTPSVSRSDILRVCDKMRRSRD